MDPENIWTSLDQPDQLKFVKSIPDDVLEAEVVRRSSGGQQAGQTDSELSAEPSLKEDLKEGARVLYWAVVRKQAAARRIIRTLRYGRGEDMGPIPTITSTDLPEIRY